LLFACSFVVVIEGVVIIGYFRGSVVASVVFVIVFKRACLWEVVAVKGSKLQVGLRGFVEVAVVKGGLLVVAKLMHYFP
jgi:hypothetical protein